MSQSIVALVPTISPARVNAATPWLRALRAEGIDVRIVANAASVVKREAEWAAPVIDTGGNPGFARSLSAALETIDEWDWVVLLNDDLIVRATAPRDLRQVIDDARSARAHPGIVYFDPEPERPVPGSWGVFFSLSLLEAAGTRLMRRAATTRPTGVGYKSFSAVAIHRDVWAANGGLDERFLFCFEDAFFIRAHLSRGGSCPTSVDIGISHEKSTTTSRHIASVLPAVAFSASAYLRALGTPARVADAIVVGALIVRTPLTIFAAAAPREHLRGIARAFAAVLSRREPSLPPYEQL